MYLMKCGHAANARDEYGNPCCLICMPKPEAMQIDRHCKGRDGLDGRFACCNECGKKTESRWELPFFKYCPDQITDKYYCGCWGWD